MEDMEDMLNLHTDSSIAERWQAKYLPLGRHIYNGMGFILPNKKYWTPAKLDELQKWCEDYDCKIDGPVIEFPDMETFTLFKLTWG
jgi:hypothetical protein